MQDHMQDLMQDLMHDGPASEGDRPVVRHA